MSSFQWMNPAVRSCSTAPDLGVFSDINTPKRMSLTNSREGQRWSKMVDVVFWYTKKHQQTDGRKPPGMVDSNLLRFGTFDRLMPKSHQGAPPGTASSAIFSSFVEATRWASPEAVLNLTGCTFRVAIASYCI